MKIKNLYINLLFLVLGAFCLQSPEFDSFSTNLLLENEIEDYIDDAIELNFEKLLSDSYGGSNTIISTNISIFINPHITKAKLVNKESKDLSKKPHLFILYCCLKLDC